MKTASNVISWIVGIIESIVSAITLSNGIDLPHTSCSYGGCTTTTLHQPTPAWLWVIFVIALIVRLIILIWRIVSLNYDNRIAAGIFTLIFVSVIGGILTFMIPEEHSRYYYENRYKTTSSSNYLSPLGRAQKMQEYEKQLENHEITYDDYKKKVAALDEKKNDTNAPSKESNKMNDTEKVEAIAKYKTLLDSGAITQEEYDKKKEELLK